MDNSRVHSGGSCDILHDLLWNTPGFDGQPLNIAVIPFPTRSPELNPIELNWSLLLTRLNRTEADLYSINGYGGLKLIDFANFELSRMSHIDNIKNYRKQGYY